MENAFRLLVFVDDDRPTNVFHEIVLNESELCHSYQFFYSATDAVDFLSENLTDPQAVHPEFIFIDLNLPMVNGWELIKKLEALQDAAPVRVVILTTSNYYTDQERATKSPIVEHFLTKPLTKEHLQALQQHLRDAAS